MEFKPPSDLPALVKAWEKLETPEQFCEVMQHYLVAQCELMNVAMKKGIIINSVTGLNQQTGKFAIANLSFTKQFFNPS